MWAQIRAWLTDNREEMLLRLRPGVWGMEALFAADTIIGWGEEGGNNRGPELDILRRGRKIKPWQGGEWCADTMSWCIEEGWAIKCGYSSWEWLPHSHRKRCPVKRSRGAVRLGNRIAKAGCLVKEADISPGDFAIYKRRGGGHIAIVSEVTNHGYTTIDGNKGRYNRATGHGSKVRKFRHEWGEPELRFFARLP